LFVAAQGSGFGVRESPEGWHQSPRHPPARTIGASGGQALATASPVYGPCHYASGCTLDIGRDTPRKSGRRPSLPAADTIPPFSPLRVCERIPRTLSGRTTRIRPDMTSAHDQIPPTPLCQRGARGDFRRGRRIRRRVGRSHGSHKCDSFTNSEPPGFSPRTMFIPLLPKP